MKKLDNWAIDRSWLNSVLLKSNAYETISFDIFDTALTRVCDSPVDVFADVESRLSKAGFKYSAGFADLREKAEQNARSKQFLSRNAEDVSLDEIYAELPELNKNFKEYNEIKLIELQTEKDTLFAVPDILELVRELKARGKNVIFVSDMYLPSAFLSDVLRDCGYDGWNELIVSNEVNATKGTGNIWPLLKQRYPGTILHIGDDEWSDVESPRRHGIDSVSFERARTERRIAGSLRPDILAFSKAARKLTLHRKGSMEKLTNEAIYEDLGRTFGTLIVGSFIRWMIERAKLHGVNHLYFCARDGYLLQQVWNRLELSKVSGLTTSYLEVARRPLNLARGFVESQPQKLDQSLVEFLCGSTGATTVSTILKRIDLHNDAKVVKKALNAFGSLEVTISSPDKYAAMAGVFEQTSKIVYKKLQGYHDRLIAYLKQEGLSSDRKVAIVDMGWHGTMQRSMHKLIDPEGENKHNLIGFYYGLWPRALENIHASGLMEVAFSNMFLKPEQQPELHEIVDVLEELHSAPHGTVLDYNREDGDHWSAVTADSPLEMQQFEKITRHFQYGVVEELAAIYAGNGSTGLKLEDLTIANGVGAMGAIALSPSPTELNALSQLGHCETFDHLTLSGIISNVLPTNRDEMYESFWSSHWRIGLLRSWLKLLAPEKRSIIVEIANNHMPYQHERTKRIFR
ncbi:HAD family hydrolase [Brucella gallinifaecis]|uniref:HAD family hydrolase n=1 Tax=Brucella gallinifaecis TaxID=215590 RepID=UPI00236170A7|nr:HAD family hydrolase [Brucella gallinifaecis]